MRFRVAGVDLGQASDPAAAAFVEQDQPLPEGTHGPRDDTVRVIGLRQFPIGLDYTVLVDELLAFDVECMVVEYNGVGRPVVDMMRRAAAAKGYRGRIHPIVTAASHIQAKMVTEQRGRKWVVPKQEIVSSINLLQRKNSWAACGKCGHPLPAVGMRCTAPECKVRIEPDGEWHDGGGRRWVVEGFNGSHHGPYDSKEEARAAVKQMPSEGKATGGGLAFPSREQVPEMALLYSQLRDFQQRQKRDTGAVQFGNLPGGGRHDDLVIALGLACWWILRFVDRRKELAVVW